MNPDWRQKIAAPRLWAVAPRRFPYLAAALFALVPVEHAGSGTLAVDAQWRLYFDPTAVAAWSVEELGAALVHEAMHLLRAHAERATGAGVHDRTSAATWNLACDAEINDDLAEQGLVLPGHPVTPATIGCADGRLAEEYYRHLDREADRSSGPGGAGDQRPERGCAARERSAVPPPAPSARSASCDCGSGADGRRRGYELAVDAAAAPGLTSVEANALRHSTARAALAAHRSYGTLPAGVVRWATGITASRVDWRRELAAEVRTAATLTAGAADYTYRRRSRRMRPGDRVVRPALCRPVVEVAVIVDTSGSVDDALLALALGEVTGIVRACGYGRVQVIGCDSVAGPAQRCTAARELTLRGAGGTDMRAGVEAALALRPRPGVIVILTDGYTPWPANAPAGTRIVVGLLGGGTAAPPQWARTVLIVGGNR